MLDGSHVDAALLLEAWLVHILQLMNVSTLPPYLKVATLMFSATPEAATVNELTNYNDCLWSCCRLDVGVAWAHD